MEGFGRRLKELRQTAKITQSDLADKLNLHPQTVSKWERGLSEPDIAQLGELAAALGYLLEKLLGREEAEISYVGTFRAEAFGKMLSELRAWQGREPGGTRRRGAYLARRRFALGARHHLPGY